ncbi:emp24/gp25L/p24 family/GOLD family protein [Babesia bovis T2Bo]|uniref:Conserved, membrane protein, putative n=1 Tax=Babesia bovis TaxID=5865 RepID=A7AQG9_BABBO|nr:emp24/gp25L/p24 family/GOLD family protein [Babesia bovis T2Bo]EDO06788.1 emp24/gp25L/p24 family/GOLD family protein [Babesia bovis T2Bo]|eukprot:XP_001610356.1 conserved, membrane protein [Babesia bovis T2Bo]
MLLCVRIRLLVAATAVLLLWSPLGPSIYADTAVTSNTGQAKANSAGANATQSAKGQGNAAKGQPKATASTTTNQKAGATVKSTKGNAGKSNVQNVTVEKTASTGQKAATQKGTADGGNVKPKGQTATNKKESPKNVAANSKAGGPSGVKAQPERKKPAPVMSVAETLNTFPDVIGDAGVDEEMHEVEEALYPDESSPAPETATVESSGISQDEVNANDGAAEPEPQFIEESKVVETKGMNKDDHDDFDFNIHFPESDEYKRREYIPPPAKPSSSYKDIPEVEKLSTGPVDSLDRIDMEDFGDSDYFYDEWNEKMEGFHPSAVLSFDIGPKGTETFYENVRSVGALLRGMYYTLSKAEELKVRLTIKSPSGEILFDKEGAEGIYAFDAKVTGIYTFEIYNSNWMTSTGVTFAAGNDEYSLLTSDHIRDTESRLEDLKNNVESVYAQFKYIWLHNHRQMRASRDAQTKLLLYSVLQLIVVGVCSMICVTYVKKIVSHKRIL